MIRATETGIEFEVRVVPRAGRNALAGAREGRILVRLAAAPVDGAANDALVAFLAEVLRVPKREIRIVSGERSRSKRVRVDGVSTEEAAARLSGS